MEQNKIDLNGKFDQPSLPCGEGIFLRTGRRIYEIQGKSKRYG
jgi:hypothetical protein